MKFEVFSLSMFLQSPFVLLLSPEDIVGPFMDLGPYVHTVKNAETALGVREQVEKNSS